MTSKSVVYVTFVDNSTKEYEISANPSVAGYLSRSMGETGSLSLWNNDESYVIPSHSIKEFCVKKKPSARKKKSDVETQ